MASSLTFIEYLRSILAIIVFFLMFAICTPVIAVLLLLSFGRATNFIVENFGPIIAYPVLWTLGIRFNVIQHGEPVNPPVIYTINHSSTLDLVTMIALGLPHIRFVAKWELQYNPLFFIVGRLTGQIFIQRKRSAKAIQKLQNTYDRIHRDNLSIMVAPEGSRKHPGVIGPFKKGAFHMAIDLGLPIVPIYFEGNQELSLGGSLFSKSGTINAHIHPPVDTSEWKKETMDEHIKQLRDRYLEWAGVSKAQDIVS
ncbi:lysophospholipid acyltransferase family protein [Gracilimonas mengyeensis]|uniref:1-acyl-sn-glycerol-3-phosphate acyltransferases n=1 Tax=Gracilimonas mengyeensis TaxID=1302730 RepID=A0A521BS28_9BACT|nr:lysophospholipid acyltransferase family protein [Gracilimonas mengyeensis]SMO49954.1 1-acyl-sn-glycerol-3-phosphate acyltransferases [Gracilimonas mengyeensis]